jgi:hypothetical protein
MFLLFSLIRVYPKFTRVLLRMQYALPCYYHVILIWLELVGCRAVTWPPTPIT